MTRTRWSQIAIAVTIGSLAAVATAGVTAAHIRGQQAAVCAVGQPTMAAR